MTMRIKSSHPESQGAFVIIEDADFNPDTMEEYGIELNGPSRDEMKSFLTEKGVEFPANIKGDKLVELYELAKAA